ncbi:DUF302 domain-containing protein [Nocardioides sp. Kera G14]|uniref:DUF302 domain-containing protein n=1 Tax=Nocardioides sp. Kera G14 TaxID=2884264 RepID=UPI001D114560|nr:DUF302 domain-containing protein [Nocardioides sp. Kera G14]UDY24016.1 DUF302 domain-containing protein [Nocardioides sp. Kera G14]
MNHFTLSASVVTPYDQTVERVRELLADAGFGVLTEIDLAATLRAKLGVEIEPRIILGACRPALAHQALELDSRVATLLPCNVVVAAAVGGATVEVFDPAVMTQFSPALAGVAADARARLSGMMSALTGDVEDPHATRA